MRKSRILIIYIFISPPVVIFNLILSVKLKILAKMVFICENCQIFKSSNVKSFTNHKRSCRKNKKQFPPAGEYNHAGILKFPNHLHHLLKFLQNQLPLIVIFYILQLNKELNLNFSPRNSSHGDKHFHFGGDNPLNSFYEDSQQSHEFVHDDRSTTSQID